MFPFCLYSFPCFCSTYIWFICLCICSIFCLTTHNIYGHFTTTPSDNFITMYLCSSFLLSVILHFYTFKFMHFNDTTCFILISTWSYDPQYTILYCFTPKHTYVCWLYLILIVYYLYFIDITWVASKVPTTPWRWQPLAETCWGKSEIR
jgi:hypothetical protein